MLIYNSLNQALIGVANHVKEEGWWETARGSRCRALHHPLTVCITNPTDRYVNIPERKWNKILPFVESLWIAMGINDLDALPGNYVKNLYKYSDDGKHWRAGYGPRIRAYSGIITDYARSEQHSRHFMGVQGQVDQLKYVIESLKRDKHTRQAVIEIADPAKDSFNPDGSLKTTKDYPCSRLLNFQVRNECLDLTVYMRSNDLLFGFSAVNVFNFTLIQEYVSIMTGIPIGKYYHIANNMHYYENMEYMVDEIVNTPFILPTPTRFEYAHDIASLEHFDKLVEALFNYEKNMRETQFCYQADFGSELFNDWGKALFTHHSKVEVEFTNPMLNRLFYGHQVL